MTEAESFYLGRDNRTALYLKGRDINQQPIHVVLDSVAAISMPGQACALAIANQLCRVHRNVSFIIPDPECALQVPSLLPAQSLGEALLGTAERIDPYGTFCVTDRASNHQCMSIGIGESVPAGLDWYIGAAGAIALLQRTPCALDLARPSTIRGAALASCRGACAIMRSSLDLLTPTQNLSAWNYREGDEAEAGPDQVGPIDVGKTLLVGVGAVGAALVYWLNLFGVRGSWVVVDPDSVALSNTNRQMLYFPADAGWGGGTAALKAEIASRFLPRSKTFGQWYHKCEEINSVKFDVVLALANEHDVRTRLAHRNPAVMMHATTGENWICQLHRHVLGVDDCIRCRMNDIRSPQFGCSTSSIRGENLSVPDAALPFISAASGLMLATALQKLHLGQLATGSANDWRWYFDSEYRIAGWGERRCNDGCQIIFPVPLRRNLNEGTRWAALIQ